jgi:hypothetical protein
MSFGVLEYVLNTSFLIIVLAKFIESGYIYISRLLFRQLSNQKSEGTNSGEYDG